MLESIRLLCTELDKKNINYCHWKSNEHLKDALEGNTDLDILFDSNQRLELEQVFAKCGLKRFRATPLMQYNGIEDFIGFDKQKARIWHVHTHYRMTLGEKHLKGYTINLWTTHVLKNRTSSPEGIYTSLPEDELVLLLIRMALKIRFRDYNKKIGKDDIAELSWLIKRTNKEKVYAIASELINEECAALILDLLKKQFSMKRDLIPLQRKLRKELCFFTAYSVISSYIVRTKRELFWLLGGIKRRLGLNNYKPSRRISPVGGTVVAILGCDGAGKSTTINRITKEFNKKIDVVNIYFGSGDGSSSIIRKPMKYIAKKVGGKGVGHKVEKEYENKKVTIKARLYSIAKIIWAITLAKEKQKKIRQMIKARNNGLLVITDRFPQCLYPGCGDGPLLNKYLEKSGLLGKMSKWENGVYQSASINPPDLTIKLTVPTELAIKRKPEMTENEIEQKKAIIEELNISSNTAVIDTSKSIDNTCGEVMEEIWKII